MRIWLPILLSVLPTQVIVFFSEEGGDLDESILVCKFQWGVTVLELDSNLDHNKGLDPRTLC